MSSPTDRGDHEALDHPARARARLGATGALAASSAEIQATLETEPFFEDEDADADDPAIWVHPRKRERSIVLGTLKNGGLAVFDLGGKTIQLVDYEDEDARQNNVDLLYDARLGGGNRAISRSSPSAGSTTFGSSTSTREEPPRRSRSVS